MNKLLLEAELNPRAFFKKYALTEMRKEFHPDKVGNDTIFKRFGELYEEINHPTSKIKQYEITRVLGTGDLRTVYEGFIGNQQFIIKTPRVISRAANNLAAKEIEVCKIFQEAAVDSTHRFYFPDPVETFTIDKQRINIFNYPLYRTHTLKQIAERHKNGLRGKHIVWMFKRILVGLGFA